jgi:tRNA dimethylallyltransferase
VKADRKRRTELDRLEAENPWYLRNLLHSVDPDTAAEFHPANTRYIIRAIEIYEQTGIPKSILAQEHPVDHPLLMISLERSVESTNILIRKRVVQMIQGWLIQEVQSLLGKGYSPDVQSMNGIGYRQTVARLQTHDAEIQITPQSITDMLQHPKSAIYELIEAITLASIQYSKRQRTRFRRYQKDSHESPKYNVWYRQIDMER